MFECILTILTMDKFEKELSIFASNEIETIGKCMDKMKYLVNLNFKDYI